MLAINRTARVIGRINLLINSINTINIIKLKGVPLGTKCDSIFFVFFSHPYSINLTHNGREVERVSNMCLVDVKINGSIPIELLIIIIINNGKNMFEEK